MEKIEENSKEDEESSLHKSESKVSNINNTSISIINSQLFKEPLERDQSANEYLNKSTIENQTLNPANQLDLRRRQEKSQSVYQKKGAKEQQNPDDKMSSDIVNQEQSDTKIST